MKENENKEPSSTAGAAKGGNTNNELIGSAVSTAVGEPVATAEQSTNQQAEKARFEAWARRNSFYLLEMPEKNKHGPASVYYNERTQQAWEGWQACARLAAPTQAKPVDLSGLTRYDIEHDGCGWMRDCIKGDYVKFADVESLLAAPTQVSAPQADIAAAALAGIERAEWYAVFNALRDARTYLCKDGVRHTWLDGAVALAEERAKGKGTYSSAPQASAAQEVRAVPDDEFEDWGSFIRSAGYIETRPGHFERPTSTSTAPAAMDEAKFDDVAALWWDAAKGEAAMYVAAHCVDGEVHAEHIMEQKRPKFGSQPSLDEVTGAGKGEGDE